MGPVELLAPLLWSNTFKGLTTGSMGPRRR